MISQPILRILTFLAILSGLTFATPNVPQWKRLPQDTNPGDSLSSAIGSLVSQISGAGGSILGLSTSGSSSSPTAAASSSSQSSSSSTLASTSSSSSSSVAPSTSHTSSSSSSSSAVSTTAHPKTTEKPVSRSLAVVTVVHTTDGSTYTSLSSSTPPASSSTGSPSLSQSQSQTSGMTTKTKTTVIGVVVGIGGAIILGGLFIVAWRIWGRGKREDDTSDGLMGYRAGSSHGMEKTGSSAGSTVPGNPFQSTLESYHNPAKQLNASSNF